MEDGLSLPDGTCPKVIIARLLLVRLSSAHQASRERKGGGQRLRPDQGKNIRGGSGAEGVEALINPLLLAAPPSPPLLGELFFFLLFFCSPPPKRVVMTISKTVSMERDWAVSPPQWRNGEPSWPLISPAGITNLERKLFMAVRWCDCRRWPAVEFPPRGTAKSSHDANLKPL